MKKSDLFEHFERHYFHELEVKEKLTNRIQVSFALLVGEYTVLSYMLRTVDYSQDIETLILFGISILTTIGISAVSAKHMLKGFHGNAYSGIPSPSETESYRQELINHKEKIEEYNRANPNHKQPEIDVETKLDSYLYGKYEKCCSINIEVNSNRMDSIHDAIKWLLRSAIPLAISSLIFIIVDLDSSSPRRISQISDEKVANAISALCSKIEEVQQVKENDKPCLKTKHHRHHHRHHQKNQGIESSSNTTFQATEKIMSEDDKKPAPPPPSPPPEPSARLIKDGSDKNS